MRRFLLLPILAILAGCGDSPSTPIAPDQKPLDASKMPPDQVDKMLEGAHSSEHK